MAAISLLKLPVRQPIEKEVEVNRFVRAKVAFTKIANSDKEIRDCVIAVFKDKYVIERILEGEERIRLDVPVNCVVAIPMVLVVKIKEKSWQIEVEVRSANPLTKGSLFANVILCFSNRAMIGSLERCLKLPGGK